MANDWMFLSKITNKARMSALATSTQQCTRYGIRDQKKKKKGSIHIGRSKNDLIHRRYDPICT